jgi:hypothetical protein
MAALSNYLENKIIDLIFRGQSFTPPSTLYYAVFTTAPNDTGGGVECTGGSYARVAVTASLANFAGTQGAGTSTPSTGTTGSTSNNVDIQFPSPTASWGTVVAMGVYDAPTGGNLICYGAVLPPKVVNSGDLPPKFSVGQWVFQLDTDAD